MHFNIKWITLTLCEIESSGINKFNEQKQSFPYKQSTRFWVLENVSDCSLAL